MSNSNLSGILSECLSPQGHKMAALPLQRSLSYSFVGFVSYSFVGVFLQSFFYIIFVEIMSHGQDYLSDRLGNVVFIFIF